MRTKNPGRSTRVGVGHDAAHEQGPGRRVEPRLNKFDCAAVGKTLLVGKPDIDRHFVQIGEGQPMLAQILPDLQHRLLTQIGDHIDWVELGDFGECRLLSAAADDVAGVDQMLADDAVKRRPDLRIAQVQLVQRHRRPGGKQ